MHDQHPAELADTILVVEDEVLIRMVIADHLRDCGYRIFEAGTVDEAIKVLEVEPRIDILFTDIRMPGGRNGFELCLLGRAEYPAHKSYTHIWWNRGC